MQKNLYKIGFLMPTAKNGLQILDLHPKNIYFKKKYHFFNANLLEKFQNIPMQLYCN